MPSMANGNGEDGSFPAPGADTTPSTTFQSSKFTPAYGSTLTSMAFDDVGADIGPESGNPPSSVANPSSSNDPDPPPTGTWSRRTARVRLVPSGASSIHSSNTRCPSPCADSRSSISRRLAPSSSRAATSPPAGSASDGDADVPLNALSSRWRFALFFCFARS